MKGRTKALIAAGILAIGGIGAGVAAAGSNDDATEGPDTPITGTDVDQASRVALDHVGEGTVTETEEGDEESYFEVEVTKGNGDQVDVQLDRDFNVVGDKTEKARTYDGE
jgi:hypothetical protein